MKTRTFNFASIIAIAVLFISPTLHAETLASWDFSANLDPTNPPVVGVSANPVSFGSFSGVIATANYGRSTASGGSLFSRIAAATTNQQIIQFTEGGAITSGTYFTFTLNPDEGYTLDITSFSSSIFTQTLSSANPQTAYTVNFFLRSSVDNYASNLATGSKFSPAVAANVGQTTTPVAFDASLNLTNLDSSVTFRIYAYVATDTPTEFQTLRLDNVTFNGTVSVIPEPSAAALMVVAGLGGVVLRRCFCRVAQA